jgi:hypothetical protein
MRPVTQLISAVLFTAGLFGACAAIPPSSTKRRADTHEVVWLDKSQSQPLWACMNDPDNPGRIMCMDFKEVVELAMPGALECEAKRRQHEL